MSESRYTDRTYIGSGGMASVYKAYDTLLGRYVAIKEIADQLRDNEEIRAMFLKEARKMAQIRDANVVQVYDVIEDSSVPTIVMELMSGGNMASRLGENSVAPADALNILEQVVSGLKAIHDAGVVHRDLKPENILEGEGQYKITDFGVAMDGEEDILPFITNRYAAPEVLIDPASIGPSSDLYSLGIMTIELILGTQPFEELVKETILGDPQIHIASIKGSAQAFWQQWIASSTELPLLNTLDSSISPEISHFLRHLTSRDPAARPGSCAEVLEEIRKIRQLESRRVSAATQYDPKLKKQMDKKKELAAAEAQAKTDPEATGKKKKPLWFKLTAGVLGLLLAAIAALMLIPSEPPGFHLDLVTVPPGASVIINGEILENDPTPTWINGKWGDTLRLELAGTPASELTISEDMPGLSDTENGKLLEIALAQPLAINTSAEAAALIEERARNDASLGVILEGFKLADGHYSVVVGTPLRFNVSADSEGYLTVLHLGADDAVTLVYPSPTGQALALQSHSLAVGPELSLVATEPLGKEWMVFVLSAKPLPTQDIGGFQRIRDWGRRYPFGGSSSAGRELTLWLLNALENDEVATVLVATEIVYRLASP